MRAWVLLSAAVVVAMGAYTSRSLKLTTELEYFLPEGTGESRLDSDVLRSLSQSSLSRRMAFLVCAPTDAQAIAATQALQRALGALPVDVASNTVAGQWLVKALFDHRYHFASDTPESELPELFAPAGLMAAVVGLKDALASPAGALVRGVAPRDPLLLSQRSVQRLSALNKAKLRMQDGALLAPEAPCGVVFALSQAAAFDGKAQTHLWTRIDQALARLRLAHPSATIRSSALSRHAVAAEKSMRRDVTRVSVVSTVAILLLLWLTFTRARYLALLPLPLVAGFVAGTFACLAAFGRVHAMTFAFGSSLIGVCIDYPIHLVNHLVLTRVGEKTSIRHVLVALLLGCVTTALGLGGLGWGGLPGLREIAVFGAVGVTAAFITTILWLPGVVGASTPRHQRAAAFSGALLTRALAHPKANVAVLLVTGLACVIGLRGLQWQDDPQKLTVLDPALEREDAHVRSVALGQEGSDFIVLLSREDEQGSLQANDALAVTLLEATAAGEVQAFASLHNVIWSESLQMRNVAVAHKHLNEKAIAEALAAQDFEAGAFLPFGSDGHDLAQPPLRLADLPRHVYDTFVAPWFVHLPDGRLGLLTRLTNVKDAGALARRIAKVPGARYVNVAQFRSQAYAGFRGRMVSLLAVGLVLVVVLLLVVYRDWRLVLCAFGPAVASALFATALLGLLGRPLNLMHVMGLLLVLSMGVDYGIFVVESMKSGAPLAPPALSVGMACVSTVLSFGLLALSSSPALQAVGETIGIGIVAAMVLSVALASVFLPHLARVKVPS
ncbi:MAG: hypothetical protein SF187_04720 [Deltaproteobacteria bacterium]|nr:hypothetical protein [Deltaproteobacteria bacterium]